jgi:hypothetical protein
MNILVKFQPDIPILILIIDEIKTASNEYSGEISA